MKIETSEVELHPIKNYPGYKVNKLGLIWSNYSGKFLKKCKNRGGYHYVCLKKGKKYQKVTVHKIVASVFLKKGKGTTEVNHIDGNKLNNSVFNLEWVTSSQNKKHGFNLGLYKKKFGEKNTMSKLTTEEVIKIKYLLKSGLSQYRIAEIFNVRQSLISRIKTGKRWGHL